MNHPDKDIMQRAIRLAEENYRDGGHAVAAIIIKDDKIISAAYTTVRHDNDPTAHAEINAIRIAAKLLGYKLLDCYLYTTYEPCPMCTSAAVWSKMKGIIYGASMGDQTESHPQRITILASEIISNSMRKSELYPEFLRAECKHLLSLEVKN